MERDRVRGLLTELRDAKQLPVLNSERELAYRELEIRVQVFQAIIFNDLLEAVQDIAKKLGR